MSVDNTEYSIVNTAFRIFLTPRKKKAGEKENRERFGQRRVPAFPVCRKTEKPVTAVRPGQTPDPHPAGGMPAGWGLRLAAWAVGRGPLAGSGGGGPRAPAPRRPLTNRHATSTDDGTENVACPGLPGPVLSKDVRLRDL
jgi:hypothetical protein